MRARKKKVAKKRTAKKRKKIHNAVKVFATHLHVRMPHGYQLTPIKKKRKKTLFLLSSIICWQISVQNELKKVISDLELDRRNMQLVSKHFRAQPPISSSPGLATDMLLLAKFNVFEG